MKSFKMLAGIVATTAIAMAAPAASSAAITGSFEMGGSATAGWVTFTPAPPGATDTSSIAFNINATDGNDFDDYALFRLNGVPAALPATAPSFAFRSTVDAGQSGGSPRLNIRTSDGGSMDLRPLTWTKDVWTTIDGAGANWDNSGGCGNLFNATYAAVVACHPGATVTSAKVVDDSGWVAPGGYTHYIDDVKYGDTTISAPPAPPACKVDPSGAAEKGPLSGIVRQLELVLGAESGATLGGVLKGINCDLVVALGL